jgi:hypothetical protein
MRRALYAEAALFALIPLAAAAWRAGYGMSEAASRKNCACCWRGGRMPLCWGRRYALLGIQDCQRRPFRSTATEGLSTMYVFEERERDRLVQ